MLNRLVMFLITGSVLGGAWFWLNQSDGYALRAAGAPAYGAEFVGAAIFDGVGTQVD